MFALLLVALSAPLATESPSPLSLSDLLARARVSPEQLAAEAAIAEAERLLAETSSRWREGWSLGFAAGPRWTDESTRADLGVDLDLPLWRGGEARAELAAKLAEVAAVWRAEARAITERRVVVSALAVVAAEQALALRRDELATLERLLAVARRRVEAGADPPYEATLVEAERSTAGLALALAEAAQTAARAELARWAEVPPNSAGDSWLPEEVPADSLETLRAQFRTGALARAPLASAVLARHLGRLGVARDDSRWNLRAGLAHEAEERVARAGAAYRFPLQGEREAIARQAETAAAAARRDAELEVAALEGRLESALRLRQALDAAPPPAEVETALDALELRLAAGKAQASEVLPIRRQLLAARQTALELRQTRQQLEAELLLLTREVPP